MICSGRLYPCQRPSWPGGWQRRELAGCAPWPAHLKSCAATLWAALPWCPVGHRGSWQEAALWQSWQLARGNCWLLDPVRDCHWLMRKLAGGGAHFVLWQCELPNLVALQSGGQGLLSTQLSSISAFSMDLKRIPTPHRLLWDFRAVKTVPSRLSGGWVQVWVQFWAPAGHLSITPVGYSRRKSKVLTAKSKTQLIWPRSSIPTGGRTGEHQLASELFPSWQQSLLAATAAGSEERVKQSCDTELVWESKEF